MNPALWPIPLPGADGRENEWHRSARIAAGKAMEQWVRLEADRALGGYKVFAASGQIEDPTWPKETLGELLKVAFGPDRLHPNDGTSGSEKGCAARPDVLPFREVWLCGLRVPRRAAANSRARLHGRTRISHRPRAAAVAERLCALAGRRRSGRSLRRCLSPTSPSAELGAFLALGWPLPEAVLDLYVEFRAETNGLPTPSGSGLLGALAYHGLDSA